jgi:hypothetical protein
MPPHVLLFFWQFTHVTSIRMSHEARKPYLPSKLEHFLIGQMLDNTSHNVSTQAQGNAADNRISYNRVRSFAVGSIEVLVVDTREASTRVDVPGVEGQSASNVGAGKAWNKWWGLQLKTKYLIDYLTGTENERNENRMVVLIDGGDVIYGGCSEKDLMEGYNLALRASTTAEGTAPKIVLGAELGSFPKTIIHKYSGFKSRQHRALSMANISDEAYARFADCRESFYGPCSEPVSMQFMNSGFYMGPAKDVLSMLHAIRWFKNDQEGAAHFMFHHPDECTLDYSGDLVLNLHNFKESKDPHDILNDPDLVVHVEEEASGRLTVKNRVTGRTSCFLHGNGNGKDTVFNITREIVRWKRV